MRGSRGRWVRGCTAHQLTRAECSSNGSAGGSAAVHGVAYEVVHFECECIDPLDDTRDARWISLTSITMKHAVLIRGIM